MATEQLFLEDVTQDSGFALRERDEILRPAGRTYRLTQADRARLVQGAVATVGYSASAAGVNAALRAKVSEMFRPFTTEEVLATAAAVSPCRLFAVLPITERAFYAFINLQFSPSVRELFLWEEFARRNRHFRFVSVHRDTSIVRWPWWSEACHNLIFRSGQQTRRGGHWQSFGLLDEAVAPLVAMFPKPNHERAGLLPDDMAR